MRCLSQVLVIAACLCSLASAGMVPEHRHSKGTRRSGKAPELARRGELIRSPVHLPPRPVPLALGLDENDIDEEDDSDKVENPLTVAPFSLGATAALLTLPQPYFTSARGTPRLLTVGTILRC